MVSVAPNIMSEAFADETVVVNMDRGHYYALNGVSAELWAQIAGGKNDVKLLIRETAINPEAIDAFLRLLSQEGLISGHPAFVTSREPEDCLSDTSFANTFERFTDVEGLLLLDPIHDFESANWPSPEKR